MSNTYTCINIRIKVKDTKSYQNICSRNLKSLSLHSFTVFQVTWGHTCMAMLFSLPIPPLGRILSLLRTRDITDPLPTWGSHRGLVVGVFDCGPKCRRFESALCRSTLTFPSVVHDWVNKVITIVCARPEDGLRCLQGVKPPLKLKSPFSNNV